MNVWTTTMNNALKLGASAFPQKWRGRINDIDALKRRCVNGDETRLRRAMAGATKLLDEAILLDPRLGRGKRWTWAEEGDVVDSARYAAGEELCCRRRTTAGYSKTMAAGDPIRVVVSTDTNEIKEGSAGAFIATAMLTMQYHPLEVYWQGSWINPRDGYEGEVFLIPLLVNAQSFRRLEFVINDPQRDTLSYAICRARTSKEPGMDRMPYECLSRLDEEERRRRHVVFIDHGGIVPC